MFSEEDKKQIRKIFKQSLFKRIFRGQDSESDITKKVVKNSNLSPAKKCIVLIDMYKYYFAQGIESDAKLQAYELYYEQFMINGQKDEARFMECYSYSYDDILFFNLVTLTKAIEDIKGQGIDYSELSTTKQKYVQMIQELKENCGFDADFNYPAFYTDQVLRNDISHKMHWFVQDYKKLMDNDKYELGIN